MKGLAVAINTFREAIRDHILYNLLIFALLIIGGSTIIGNLTIGQGEKVITDIGLAAMSFFGVLIAIFVGINLVYKELSKKTIYNILSKPISRAEFLMGKYMGLLITIAVNLLLMTIGLLLTLYFIKGVIEWNLLPAILLIYLELMIITSVALLFSTFSTPTLSAIFTMGIYVIGHLTMDLVRLSQKLDSAWFKGLMKFLYYLLPNLDNFNIKTQVVHGLYVKPEYYRFAFIYWGIYLTIVIALATFIFSRRDFQ